MTNTSKKLFTLGLSVSLLASMALPISAAEIPTQDHISIIWLNEDIVYMQALPNSTYFSILNDEYKTALIDHTGKQLTEYVYVDFGLNGFQEGYLISSFDPSGTGDYSKLKFGFLDAAGTQVIPMVYDEVTDFSEGLAAVANYDAEGKLKYGYIDTTGQLVIPMQYDYARPFSDGLAVIAMDPDGDYVYEYSYIDKTGTIQLAEQTAAYDKLDSFSEGLAAAYVTSESRIDFIDTTGLPLFSVEGNTTNGFSECLAMVGFTDGYDTSRYGYIDMAGNWITPMSYTYAGNFSNGLACVDDLNHKRGYINTTGELVIPTQYVYGDDFQGWIATVATMGDMWGRDYGCIDTTGEVVIPFEYDELNRNGYGTTGCVKKGNSWGLFTYTPETTFTAADWAADFASDALDAGLIPYNMDLDLTKDITRETFAGLAVELYEAMSGKSAPDAAENPFTDTNSEYAKQAYALGITSGTSTTTFSPDALITREQAAVMLTAVYKQLGGTVSSSNPGFFADDDAISSWARDAVYFMAENGIVTGVGNNCFDAQNNAQSQAALIMALQMLRNLK